MIRGQSSYIAKTSALNYSADLLSFVPVHDLVMRLVPGHLETEQVAYLGLIPLLLACIGVWKLRSRAGFWVVVALVTAVLALGPLLRVGGQLLEYSYKETRSYVVLPGAVLTELPLYEWIRAPSRFIMTTALAVAVLASCGLATLLRRGAPGVTKAALTGGLVGLILLEYDVYYPFPVAPASVPAFYRDIGGDGEEYGILDVSEAPYNHRGMYYQTVHGHGIVRGHAYRIPLEASGLIRFCSQLMNPAGEIFVYDPVEILRQWKIKYVVLHKDSEANVEVQRPFLTGLLGESVYEDGQIAAFAVPLTEPAPVAPGIPLLLLGEQWHPIESIDGMPSRWMVNDGLIYVRVEQEGSYQPSLTAHPFQKPRHLQVFVEDELLQEYYVGGMQSYVTPAFALSGGEWTPIRLHVPEGCEVPSEVMEGQLDDRCLSMLFQAVDVIAVETEA